MSSRSSALASLASLILALPVAAQNPENPFKPFDLEALATTAKELGASDADLEAFRREYDDGTPALVVDKFLRKLSQPYATAVQESENGDPKAALSLSKLLGEAQAPVIRAYARYHLGRVFLDADDPEKASEVFEEFLREDRNLSPLDAEAAFFYGTSLAEIPRPGAAAKTFQDFLILFPDAPERFRAVAMQRRAELEAQEESPLHGLADVMQAVEREIRKTNTGKATQDQQQEIVTKLEQIIEQIEEQEQQSSGGPSGNQESEAPAGTSAAPTGPARVGSLQNVSGIAERWGDLKDRDRKAIEAEVAQKLPPHRRKQLEEYYKKLNRGGR
ncbi:MAG: tetratricopeptide repeat protein [Planctomycetota bacterium]|jgi:tetratricopeptide (TPR) repeat protein